MHLLTALAFTAAALLPIGNAAAEEQDATCLGCHGQSGLTKTFANGDKLELQVDGAAFGSSVHASLGCTACHSAIDLKSHPGKPHTFASTRAFQDKAIEACRGCHAPVFDAYAKSKHAAMRESGGPQCADCHRPHEVAHTSTGTQLKEACLTCHAGVPELHAKWLPNTALHFEVVSCAACHAQGVQRKVDLRLYDPTKNRELTGKDGFVAAGTADEKRLWQFVEGASREGKVQIVGRVEIANGAEAHALAPKSMAVKDCTTCHRKGAEAFQNVTFSIIGADGRRVRYEAKKEVLHEPTSVDSLPGFYAIGGTRIEILDILLALALVGGISGPILHLAMRKLSRKKDKPHA